VVVVEAEVLEVVVEVGLCAVDGALDDGLADTPVGVVLQVLGVVGADVPALEAVHHAVAEKGQGVGEGGGGLVLDVLLADLAGGIGEAVLGEG